MAAQHKTVRIPDDIVAFVEEQPGKDFSKKLVGVLCAYRDRSERAGRQDDYDEIIDEIERLAIKLRRANNKLEDAINRTLEDKQQIYQLSFGDMDLEGSCK